MELVITNILPSFGFVNESSYISHDRYSLNEVLLVIIFNFSTLKMTKEISLATLIDIFRLYATFVLTFINSFNISGYFKMRCTGLIRIEPILKQTT